MRITIALGYDKTENAFTLQFARNLGLLRSELSLVHVMERMSAWDKAAGVQGLVEQVEKDPYWSRRKAEGNAVLDEASQELRHWDVPCTTHLLDGLVGNEIIAFAEMNSSDLLVLGSSVKGEIEGIMVGSVGRKLLLGAPCSVLIAKQTGHADVRKALIASDHSAYADETIAQLLHYPKLRLKEITVLSVLDEPSVTIETMLQEKNLELIHKLSGIAETFRSYALAGNIDEVIAFRMEKEEQDLLVMASQGHGFFERILIGSHSLKAAMSLQKSILILRQKKGRQATA